MLCSTIVLVLPLSTAAFDAGNIEVAKAQLVQVQACKMAAYNAGRVRVNGLTMAQKSRAAADLRMQHVRMDLRFMHLSGPSEKFLPTISQHTQLAKARVIANQSFTCLRHRGVVSPLSPTVTSYPSRGVPVGARSPGRRPKPTLSALWIRHGEQLHRVAGGWLWRWPSASTRVTR